jgi:ABC-2 type transport system permease protein
VVYTAGPELWAKVPEFRYDPPGLGTVLAQQGWSLVVLAAWLVAACVFASRGVARLAAE